VDSVWFWQRSTCYSPEDKDEVFVPFIHVVRVSTKSLKILIAALSSSVAYWIHPIFGNSSGRQNHGRENLCSV
jgi:hypothetical protein